MNKQITLNINGKVKTLEVDTRMLLVDAIRQEAKLTGTHLGCGTGTCGACTVMLNNNTMKSCCVLAVDADGDSITTIEGVGQGDNLHPVQQSFIDNHGLQCGFCTPGMILASIALLNNNNNPTDAEIREGLSGNICRCTGYVNIVKSVAAVSAQYKNAAGES